MFLDERQNDLPREATSPSSTSVNVLARPENGLRRQSRSRMSRWPRHPVIYEINTWVWLSSISSKLGRSIQLSSVPPAEWDAIASFGFEAIWLMGVWERSPASRAIS